MRAKWKTPIKCPSCSSTAVRRREVVHKSGTSTYSGRSSSRGFSFGFAGKARPRVWFGGGSHSGKRQSLKAQEAEPLPFWPAIIVPITIFIFRGENDSFGFWSWFGFVVSGLWFLAAMADYFSYRDEWSCSKCGATFVPDSNKPENDREPDKLTEDIKMAQEDTNQENGKACSICGKWHPNSAFEYGKRENRSYCPQCNKEEKIAYSKGGAEAATEYREKMRSKWKNT
ncbi:MAG: hypothetical protein CL798_08490 [Chromatiales bacterium]|nr:hypothetical protein [Chromatiales bacterium]